MSPVLVGAKLIVKLLFGFLLLPLIFFAFFCTLCCFFLVLPFLSIFNSVVILYHALFKLPIRCSEVVLVRFCKWVLGDFGNFHEKVVGKRKLDPFEFPSPYDSQEDDDEDDDGENGKRKHEDSWTFQALKAAIKRDKLVCDGKPISIQIRGWLPLLKTSHAPQGQSSVNTPPFDKKEIRDHDMLITHDTLNGNIINVNNFFEGESSNSSIVSTSISTSTSTCSWWKWRFLWGCKVPGKTRIFVWRACLDALPTNENLSKKQITVENRCRVCGQQGESTLHVLRECVFAKQVWAVAPISLITNGPKTTVFEWVNDTSKDLDSYCFALFMTICWFLWKNRNEESHKKARDLIKSTLDYHTNYLTSPDSISKIPHSWVPPYRGSLKVNFDGVLFLEDQDLGVGIVVRNEVGEFMAGMAKKIKISGVVLPVSEFAKAAAAVEAVRFALEKGFVDVVVEGDSSTVIQSLKSRGGVGDDDDYIGSEYGVLYEDAKRMATNLVKGEFSIVRRTGNKAARFVARYARDVDFVTWMDDPPLFLMPYIINDIPS